MAFAMALRVMREISTNFAGMAHIVAIRKAGASSRAFNGLWAVMYCHAEVSSP